jgi:DNA-binding winged helix-turn-helix (wHTH) protein/TolB-like protein/tetratricopeptide (TPR) repeat protein
MNGLYRFGEFRLDPGRRVLLRGNEPLTLAPKAFDMLLVLIENRSRVLSKDELLEMVWPGTFVEEGNLKFNVSVIRKALGEESWIETLPRRGYRFAGEVEEISGVGVEVRDRTEVRVSLEAELKSSTKVWVAIGLIALAVGVGGVIWWRTRPTMNIRSIAVLPFQSIAVNGPDRELELGLTDSLIGTLGAEGNWLVRPTAAVRSYAGVERDPLAAGRSLQVDAVIDGSIQRSADRIRLTLQMLRVSDGKHLWTGKFDQKLTDLFSMEDQIAAEVARAVQVKLPRPSVAKSHSASPEVYELYLAGRHFFNEEKASTRQAIQNFELAIQRDPGFAPAHAMLALSYWQLTQRGVAPARDVQDKMRAAALRAIELDDSRAEGHVALTLAKMWLDYDWPGAQKEYKRALELNPNEPLAYFSWGLYSMAQGRFDEAEKAYRKKLEIDPRALMSIEGMGYPFAYRGQYDEAIAWYRKALELDANFPLAYNDLSAAYHLKGMHREGVQATLKAAALSGTSPERIAQRLRLFEEKGVDAFRRDTLESQLERMRQGQNVSPVAIAQNYNTLGEKQKALDWLEKGYEERTFQILWLKTWPPWASLKGEPRYHELLRKMRLE